MLKMLVDKRDKLREDMSKVLDFIDETTDQIPLWSCGPLQFDLGGSALSSQNVPRLIGTLPDASKSRITRKQSP